MKTALGDLRTAWEDAGRSWNEIHIVPMGVFPDAEKLDYYRELGVTEVVLRLPSAPRDEVMPVLDAYAGFVDGDA